jgi:hypothetical protein
MAQGNHEGRKQMTININSLVQILGYPMLHPNAAAVLKKNGFEPAYKMKELNETLSVFLQKPDLGIELCFAKRAGHEEDFALAKEEGEAIFSCIFLYLTENRHHKKYTLPIGFGIDKCKTRDDAISALGKPERTEEDDGIYEWDRWIIAPELSIRADYDENSINLWTIGVPMKL